MNTFPDHREHTKDFEEAYLAKDLFYESEELPARQIEAFQADVPSVLPGWLNETRIVCALVAVCGLLATIFNLDFFHWQINSPILLNLTLLTVLLGFVNCLAYPYALTYSLINGTRQIGLLRAMNTFLMLFMGMLILFLFSFPVSGLGLALILVPAPAVFAWYTKKYLKPDHHFAMSEDHKPFALIFNIDLRRLAWASFIVLFSAMIGVFFGLVFNLI